MEKGGTKKETVQEMCGERSFVGRKVLSQSWECEWLRCVATPVADQCAFSPLVCYVALRNLIETQLSKELM